MGKKVRCKLQCAEVGQVDAGGGKINHKAKFYAAYGDSEENRAFFAATPMATVELQVVAEQHFTPGKFYYLDFTLAE